MTGDGIEDFALQSICVHCLGEQYALSVYFVSTGEHACAWCGAYSKKMTRQEYHQALRAAGVDPPAEMTVVLPRPRKASE